MSAPAARKRSLGMGISALLGGDPGPDGARLRSIPVEHLRPSPFQPRRSFDEEELDQLAVSLRDKGVLQPLVVRSAGVDGAFEIVAGERRWRAAQRAGLHALPAIVRELDDREMLEIAIVENVQRQDLNALEEAQAYRRLIDEFGYKQEELASAVGKSRPHIANLLRLLNLPDGVQAMLAAGDLSAGHARALVGSPDALRLAEQVAAGGLSVRETERLASRAHRPRTRSVAGRLPVDPDDADAARRVQMRLGLAVAITRTGSGGTLTISWRSPEQLDLLMDRLISGG